MRCLRFSLVKSYVERPILAIKGKCIQLNPQANHILTGKMSEADGGGREARDIFPVKSSVEGGI